MSKVHSSGLTVSKARELVRSALETLGDFRPEAGAVHDASYLCLAALCITETAVAQRGPSALHDVECVAILCAAHRALFNAKSGE